MTQRDNILILERESMKKGGIGEADSYFSPFSSGASPNPKNERNKMNSMLFRQDSNLTNSPHN